MPHRLEHLRAFAGALCRGERPAPREGVTRVQPFPSTQGAVWKLDLEDGTAACLKTGSPSALRRESHALGVLGTHRFAWAPQLLAQLPGPPPALLSSWIGGTPGDASAAAELKALGRTLRALHQLPLQDGDALPLRAALEQRVQAWLRRAAGQLDPSVRVAVSARFDPDVFADARRVLCHRDVTASNWVRAPGGDVFLVDFGQARPDIGLGDLAKLAAHWHAAPAARHALLAGYGPLSGDQREQLGQLVALHGLQTAVWGREHGAPAFVALGDDILRHVLAG